MSRAAWTALASNPVTVTQDGAGVRAGLGAGVRAGLGAGVRAGLGAGVGAGVGRADDSVGVGVATAATGVLVVAAGVGLCVSVGARVGMLGGTSAGEGADVGSAVGVAGTAVAGAALADLGAPTTTVDDGRAVAARSAELVAAGATAGWAAPGVTDPRDGPVIDSAEAVAGA